MIKKFACPYCNRRNKGNANKRRRFISLNKLSIHISVAHNRKLHDEWRKAVGLA